MCNLYRLEKGPEAIRALFATRQMSLSYPEGIPNIEPRDIAISDQGSIVRQAREGIGLELVQRRWSWPGRGGKPVFNFRSEGRDFANGRCLVIADAFYEFTAAHDPKSKKKDRWRFEASDGGLFGIAGLVRSTEAGEAFTMLTVAPGPDVAAYHNRQVAIVAPTEWAAWLDHSMTSRNILQPSPADSLKVTAAPR